MNGEVGTPMAGAEAVRAANEELSRFQAIRAAQTQMVMNPATWPYRAGEKIQVGGQLQIGRGFQQYLPLILLAGIVFFIVVKK
jgi:hypothetical protein